MEIEIEIQIEIEIEREREKHAQKCEEKKKSCERFKISLASYSTIVQHQASILSSLKLHQDYINLRLALPP